MEDLDFVNASPSMPVNNGCVSSPSQLFDSCQIQYQDEEQNLMEYNSHWIYNLADSKFYSSRKVVINGLLSSLLELEPVLSTRDSIVSKNEPILYLNFKFIHVYCMELINVFFYIFY